MTVTKTNIVAFITALLIISTKTIHFCFWEDEKDPPIEQPKNPIKN